MSPFRVDYCHFLMSSQVNFTLTHYAEHHAHFSHDALNRYLNGDRARMAGKTPYQLKREMLSNALRAELPSPAVRVGLAAQVLTHLIALS
jgi:hypothetical protein